MVVLILSAAPAALRGSMTRWLLEVSPGVFVGRLSARVREQLWELVRAYIGEGRALLIWSVRSEQHFAIASLGHEREPVDVEGCLVMRTIPADRGFAGDPRCRQASEGVVVDRRSTATLPQRLRAGTRSAVKAEAVW